MNRIELTKGYIALVSDEDFEEISKHKWCVDSTQGYAVRARKKHEKPGGVIRMHRQIMNAPAGTDIDHINGNGLDNRRENLRICNRSENLRNSIKRKETSSKYKGVSWNPNSNGWIVRIKYEGIELRVGHIFLDEITAANAYDKLAKKLFGTFARINFPNKPILATNVKLTR